MPFEGHEFFKINNNWVFDKTEFIGYKIQVDRKTDTILKYEKAFKVQDKEQTCNFKYTKYINNIPLGILRKSEDIIRAYYKEALIDGRCTKS